MKGEDRGKGRQPETTEAQAGPGAGGLLAEAGVIVLAGGHSSRMGRDKRLLPFEGEPLLAHTLRLFGGRCREIIVVAGHPESEAANGSAAAIGGVLASFPRVRVVADALPDAGPLGGLSAGMATATAPYQLAVAADMPFASPALAEELLWLCQSRRAAAALPEAGGRLHPLFAAYDRSVAGSVRDYVAGGGRKVMQWLQTLTPAVLAEAAVRRIDPQGVALMNMNGPDDYREALRIWSERGAESDS